MTIFLIVIGIIVIIWIIREASMTEEQRAEREADRKYRQQQIIDENRRIEELRIKEHQRQRQAILDAKTRTVELVYNESISKNPVYFVFDCETTGFHNANIVSICWLIFDEEKKLVAKKYHLRKIDYIPEDATAIHGIKAKDTINGMEISDLINEFEADLKRCKFAIAHNMEFDYESVNTECVRLGMKNPLDKIAKICTMYRSTEFMRLPKYSGRGYKYPKLTELYGYLAHNNSDIIIANSHNAEVDAYMASFCFFELLGDVIELPTRKTKK